MGSVREGMGVAPAALRRAPWQAIGVAAARWRATLTPCGMVACARVVVARARRVRLGAASGSRWLRRASRGIFVGGSLSARGVCRARVWARRVDATTARRGRAAWTRGVGLWVRRGGSAAARRWRGGGAAAARGVGVARVARRWRDDGAAAVARRRRGDGAERAARQCGGSAATARWRGGGEDIAAARRRSGGRPGEFSGGAPELRAALALRKSAKRERANRERQTRAPNENANRARESRTQAKIAN